MKKHIVIDGKSNFFLDQYPEQAWTNLTPGATDTADSREATEAIGKYYEAVGFLHRCVSVRADALLRVPWAILRNDAEVWTSEMPTPPETLAYLKDFRRLLRLTAMALCLAPEAFWFRERNRARTLSFRWHAPTSVVPQWSANDGLTGFKRMLGNGNTRVFEVQDYVYFALPNPLHETLPGRPPAQAAMAAAGVLYNVDAFASNFFQRGAIKATLLTIDGNPPPGELLKLESWWRRAFAGVAQAWQTAAVRAGVTPVIIGEGLESLAKSDLTRAHREDIATAMGVPHSIVMSDAANRSVAETDDLHFYDKTVIPAFEMMAETLNEQVFYPAGLRMELRPQKMSIYQEDEEQRSKSVLHYTQASVPVEIAMQMLGVTLPDGMDYATFGAMMAEERARRVVVAPVQATAEGAEGEEVEIDDDEEIDDEEIDDEEMDEALRRAQRSVAIQNEVRRLRTWAKKRKRPDPSRFISSLLTDAEKRAIIAEVSAGADFFPLPTIWLGSAIPEPGVSIAAWKALALQMDSDDDEAEQRARDTIERAATRSIGDALSAQQQEIQRAVRRLDPEDFAAWAASDLEQTFEQARREFELYDTLRRALLQSVDLGVSVAIAQLESVGFGFDWTLANDAARRWADQYVGELITEINATTLERTRRAVAAWIENGEPLEMLIEDLTPIFGRQRAELIASTEVTRAYARANRESYLAAGFTRWEWRTAADERVCPVCGPLNGQTVRIDEAFDPFLPDEAVALVRRSFSSPPAHPRCRCWVVPVIGR